MPLALFRWLPFVALHHQQLPLHDRCNVVDFMAVRNRFDGDCFTVTEGGTVITAFGTISEIRKIPAHSGCRQASGCATKQVTIAQEPPPVHSPSTNHRLSGTRFE